MSAQTQIRTMLDVALEHARRGLKVFPLAAGTKNRPLIKEWNKHATVDEAQIRAFWTQHPDANVGVHAADLLVLDIDVKNENGFDSLTALEQEIFLEATYETESPSGGRHLYYALPPNVTVRNGVRVMPGVDIRTTGGFVVGAGSRTAAGEYRVIADEPLAEADSSLVERCGVSRPKAERAKDEPAISTDMKEAERRGIEYLAAHPVAEKGHRNHELMLAARKLGDFGVPVARAVDIAIEHFRRADPLGDEMSAEEMETTVRSSYRRRQTPIGSQSAEGLGFENVPDAKPVKQTSASQDVASKKFKPKPRSGLYLNEKEFQPIMFTVDNLLPEGVFLLAASPKIGKSWLTLQIALAVATGGKVLGEQATQGEALVLALEDSDRRLKSRLATLGAGDLPREALSRLHFETHWPRVDDGGAEALDEWLNEHPETRLVVVDVLERVRPRRDAKANEYGQDYEALKALKAIAERRLISIVVVHHTRKARADDAVQLVSGTQGLAGAADGILVLARARGEEQGELHVIARDLPKDGAYAVSFRDGRWAMIGPMAQVAKTDLQNEILAALRATGAPMTQAQIKAELGRAQSTIAQALKRMVRDGLIECTGKQYRATEPAYESPDGTPFEDAARAA